MSDPRGSIGRWEVYAVEYARAAAQPPGSLVLGAQGAPIDVPYAFAAARGADGIALVDTGFDADTERGRALAEANGVQRWVHPLRMLDAIGIAAPDVTDIVLSHAHFDHMGTAALFPRARLHMQKRELFAAIEALALPKRLGFMAEGYELADVQAVLNATAEHRLCLLDGDRPGLRPGLHARAAPDSHTLGSQWASFDTARGRVAVAGDCVYCRANLAAARPDGMHRPLGFAQGSALGQLRAMEAISAEVDNDLSRLVLLHDPDRWVGGKMVAEVEGMAVVRVA